MIDLSAIRNPNAEHIGAPVIVSASLCERAGIAHAYVGLFGIVIGTNKETGECLVSLDSASYERFVSIENRAFSKSYEDFDEDQWFCSGVLEIVGQ